jgi:hypothetical protein
MNVSVNYNLSLSVRLTKSLALCLPLLNVSVMSTKSLALFKREVKDERFFIFLHGLLIKHALFSVHRLMESAPEIDTNKLWLLMNLL